MKSYASATETQLIREFQKGNNMALEVLVNRYKNMIFTSILILVKDRHLAEDILQDVFVKVITQLRSDKYKDGGRFSSWIMCIARNHSLDTIRKNGKIDNVELSETELNEISMDILEDAQSKIMKSQSYNKLSDMLSYIPYEQREVIILRLFGELSFKEIAELTDSTVNTSMGRVRYGIVNLRKLMAQHQIVL